MVNFSCFFETYDTLYWVTCLLIVFTDEERAGLFEKKNFRQNRKDVHVKKLSLLSEQMEKCPNLPQNPFVEYAKYDGNVRTVYL